MSFFFRPLNIKVSEGVYKILHYSWCTCCIVILVIEVIEHVTKILPVSICDAIGMLANKDDITEIRLRVDKLLKIYMGNKEKTIDYIVSRQDIVKVLSNISLNSIYSVQNDINKGFVTIEGGNRIGIAGEVVIVDGNIKNIKDISSMNIRVAKEYIGASTKVIEDIIQNGRINNTIIVSPPGLGKTTLLRDIARELSETGYNVSIIDERGEIAAMWQGRPTLNIGERTDVISFVDKALGMQMAVRSLNPDVVCTDEIGNKADAEAIKYLCKCGVSFITTMHGDSLKDVMSGYMKEIIQGGYLDNVIILSNDNGIGSIDRIYTNLNSMEVVKC